MSKTTPTTFYQKTFQKATPTQQATFLEQLFEKDSYLCAQFQNFIASWQTKAEKIRHQFLALWT